MGGIYPPSGFYIPEFHPRGGQPSIIKKTMKKTGRLWHSFLTLLAHIAGTNVHLTWTVGSLRIHERPHAHKYTVYIYITFSHLVQGRRTRYKVITIHHELWHLFGLKWTETFNFKVCLAFATAEFLRDYLHNLPVWCQYVTSCHQTTHKTPQTAGHLICLNTNHVYLVKQWIQLSAHFFHKSTPERLPYCPRLSLLPQAFLNPVLAASTSAAVGAEVGSD